MRTSSLSRWAREELWGNHSTTKASRTAAHKRSQLCSISFHLSHTSCKKASTKGSTLGESFTHQSKQNCVAQSCSFAPFRSTCHKTYANAIVHLRLSALSLITIVLFLVCEIVLHTLICLCTVAFSLVKIVITLLCEVGSHVFLKYHIQLFENFINFLPANDLLGRIRAEVRIRFNFL